MDQVLVYMTKNGVLSTKEVEQILNQPDRSRVCNLGPTNPQNGEIYVYENSSDKNSFLSQKLDGICWKHLGTRNVPKNKPPLIKTYYQEQVDNRRVNWYRHVYRLSKNDKESLKLVHYFGMSRTTSVSADTHYGLRSTSTMVRF